MINELTIIDYLALDETDNSKLLLAISDHLDWQFEQEHLLMLQEKVNNYINYILNEEYKGIYNDEIKSFEIIIFIEHKPKKSFEKLLCQFNRKLKNQFSETQIEIIYKRVETANE